MVAREMRRNPQLGMQPVGFLDDDAGKDRQADWRAPVLGDTQSLLDEIVASHRVDRRGDRHADGARRQGACRWSICAARPGVKSQTMPGVFELLDRQGRRQPPAQR